MGGKGEDWIKKEVEKKSEDVIVVKSVDCYQPRCYIFNNKIEYKKFNISQNYERQ